MYFKKQFTMSIFEKYPGKKRRRTSIPFNIVDNLILHELAYQNDARRLEQQMLFVEQKKFNLNYQDEDFGWRTPLHIACQKGNTECARILLNKGADPLLRMTQGWTPAHCAAECGNLDILKILFQHSGSLISRDDSGKTPRFIAETYGHVDCAMFLSTIENHPSQRRDVIKDQIQNAARRSVLILHKEEAI